jgi:hypothetical protein
VVASVNASSVALQFSTALTTEGPMSTHSELQSVTDTQTSIASNGMTLGITLPPNPITALSPTGTDIRSSASDLSIVFAGVFPLIQGWVDYPDIPIPVITDRINGILPKAIDFLRKLPTPTDGVEPCNSANRRRRENGDELAQPLDKRDLLGGLFKTALSLVSCVIETTTKVKDAVIDGTTAAVESVKGLQDVLNPTVNTLNEVVPEEDTKPSGSNSNKPTSTLSSSSS